MATMSMKYQHGVMKTMTNEETICNSAMQDFGMFVIQTVKKKKTHDSTQETGTIAKGMRY